MRDSGDQAHSVTDDADERVIQVGLLPPKAHGQPTHGRCGRQG